MSEIKESKKLVKKIKDFPQVNVTLDDVTNSDVITHTIYLHMDDIDITDDERIKLLSDTIIHEHIHILLEEMFPGLIVTCLFDSIGDKLRMHLALKERMTIKEGRMCWGQYIAKFGMDALLERYCLDRIKVNKILKEGF